LSNKNFKNLGIELEKDMETKISKIREPKLQKLGNKNYKNPETKLQNLRTKVIKIWNKNYKNPGTKVTNVREQKIQEQKFGKSRNKS
jgi:hypothetical protein